MNSHYNNNFPASNRYPANSSNPSPFPAFCNQINQVEGIQNGFRDQFNATNGHGGIWGLQQKGKGKKSKRNKRKKHGKGKGKNKDEVDGDELDGDKINGDGAAGNDANGDDANGGEGNGGSANGDGTRDGDTPNEYEWKF